MTLQKGREQSGKWSYLVMVVMLMSSLITGCAVPPTGTGATTPAPAGTANNQANNQTVNEEVSGQVELWHFWGSPVRRTALRRVLALCQQQIPNVEITETFKPWGDIWTANIAAVAAGTGMPDIIVEDRPQLPQRAQDQIVTDLQPYVDADNYSMDMFWPFAAEEIRYEGDVYGIPFETDVRVLLWNKQALADAGLDPEQPPQTWDELTTYADALDVQNADGSYERIGFFPLWNAGPEFWARTNGWQQVVDGKPNYNDPKFIETLEWIKGWVDRYGGWQELQNFKASFGSPPNDIFMSGAVPMIVDVAGYLSQLNFYRPQAQLADGSTTSMEWGVSFIPYQESQANWSGGFALAIPLGAENPDAAWEVIKCMASQEGQVSWARDTLAIPTNQEAATDPVLMADPLWATVMDVMQSSQGSTYVPEYPNFGQEANTRFEQVWTGELTAEQMAQQTQQAINDVMAAGQ